MVLLLGEEVTKGALRKRKNSQHSMAFGDSILDTGNNNSLVSFIISNSIGSYSTNPL